MCTYAYTQYVTCLIFLSIDVCYGFVFYMCIPCVVWCGGSCLIYVCVVCGVVLCVVDVCICCVCFSVCVVAVIFGSG